jgi:NitT/TauT family transport system ATP-binding protein
MMASPVVALRGLTKNFSGGTTALGPLNLDIIAGSFTAILGPSGCGKSTLLRLIADLSAPSAGIIDFADGRKPAMGFVFQDPTLMPWRRVDANVRLPLELNGQMDEGRVTRALQRVGLTDFAQSFPRQLSGGMRMRVSIARALAAEPQLLMMDEPFAALDELTRAALNDDLLAAWQAARFTALFVTHSVFESVYLAQRIVVLSPRPGQIIADIAVDAPYPRNEDWRLSPEFAAIARQVSQALRHTPGLSHGGVTHG